jgi:RimJ/RimL family protein N-acetyltransferase
LYTASDLDGQENGGGGMKECLEGEFTVLRVTDPERDHAHFNAWMKDSHFARLLDSDPVTLWPKKMTKEWLEKHMDDFVSFTIYGKEDTEKPIGFVSLDGIKWLSRDAWVGIGIGERDYWGKGYGTEAMRLILRHAFCQLNLHRVSLSVFDYNQRAIRSYEKAGFVREGLLPQFLEREGRRYDLILMGILRSEWKDLCPEDR